MTQAPAIRRATPRPAPVTPPAPAGATRERFVKRYVATCLLTEVPGVASDCDFIVRQKPQLHATRDSAAIEAIRHLRATHGNELVLERIAKRTVQVQRTVVGEELVEE